jgi:hypothetical protein
MSDLQALRGDIQGSRRAKQKEDQRQRGWG